MRKYTTAIESDLLEFWRLDLLDLFRETGSVSPRRVLTLLSSLGENSAFVAARRNVPRDWTTSRYLIKHQTQILAWILYVTSKANGGKPQKPAEIPAPDDEVGRKRAQRSQGQTMFAAMASRAMQPK